MKPNIFPELWSCVGESISSSLSCCRGASLEVLPGKSENWKKTKKWTGFGRMKWQCNDVEKRPWERKLLDKIGEYSIAGWILWHVQGCFRGPNILLKETIESAQSLPKQVRVNTCLWRVFKPSSVFLLKVKSKNSTWNILKHPLKKLPGFWGNIYIKNTSNQTNLTWLSRRRPKGHGNPKPKLKQSRLMGKQRIFSPSDVLDSWVSTLQKSRCTEIYQVDASSWSFKTTSQIDAITDRQLHPKCTENPPLSLVVFVFFAFAFRRIRQPLVFELIPCNFEVFESLKLFMVNQLNQAMAWQATATHFKWTR